MIEGHFRGSLGGFSLDAEFSFPGRGVTALFGQSGSGKTSLLRCMAGLQPMSDGMLRVNGETWQEGNHFLAPHQRAVGYVFQEPSLFPHLSVLGNLRFGHKRGNGDGPGLEEVSVLLGLDALLQRSPRDLSGGEQQRVAIGRALLRAPRILLMDEPLSGLDRLSKNDIIPYLERLHDELEIPVLFISHDTDEVEQLADHMLLMQQGRVTGAGPLLDMLSDPGLFIARGRKTATVLDAQVTAYDKDDQLSQLDVSGVSLLVPGRIADIGAQRRIRIAARDVSLAVEQPSRTTILNVLPATVVELRPIETGQVNVVLALGGAAGPRIMARISQRSLNSFGFTAGQQVYAQVKGVSMVERRMPA